MRGSILTGRQPVLAAPFNAIGYILVSVSYIRGHRQDKICFNKSWYNMVIAPNNCWLLSASHSSLKLLFALLVTVLPSCTFLCHCLSWFVGFRTKLHSSRVRYLLCTYIRIPEVRTCWTTRAWNATRDSLLDGWETSWCVLRLVVDEFSLLRYGMVMNGHIGVQLSSYITA